jgi:hypothetical protein
VGGPGYMVESFPRTNGRFSSGGHRGSVVAVHAPLGCGPIHPGMVICLEEEVVGGPGYMVKSFTRTNDRFSGDGHRGSVATVHAPLGCGPIHPGMVICLKRMRWGVLGTW